MGGHALAHDQPRIFGIVDENIAVALNSLNNVIASHLIGVYRVGLHPVEQIGGADQTGQIALAPANIAVKQNAGNVALDIVQRLKAGGGIVAAYCAGVGGCGLVASADLTEGQVAAGGIQLGIRGTEVVQVGAAVGGGKAAEALAPDVLTVPGSGVVPGAGIGIRGIEVNNLAAASVIGVAVFGVCLQIGIGRHGGMGVGHQGLQAALDGRGRLGRKSAVDIRSRVVGCCLGAQGGAERSPLAGVIGEGGCVGGGNQACKHGNYDSQHQEQGKELFQTRPHDITSFIIFTSQTGTLYSIIKKGEKHIHFLYKKHTDILCTLPSFSCVSWDFRHFLCFRCIFIRRDFERYAKKPPQ